jgi:peroxiredoxin
MKHVLAAVTAVVVLVSAACSKTESPRATLGAPAPAFTLKDVDGRTVRLADFGGRAVVMDFWATWCGPCKESTIEFEQLHRKHRDRGVVVIGISMDVGANAADAVRTFTRDNGLTYLMLMDDGKTSRAYAVTKVPVTYILDRSHTVTKIFPGYLPGLGDKIEQELAKLK